MTIKDQYGSVAYYQTRVKTNNNDQFVTFSTFFVANPIIKKVEYEL